MLFCSDDPLNSQMMGYHINVGHLMFAAQFWAAVSVTDDLKSRIAESAWISPMDIMYLLQGQSLRRVPVHDKLLAYLRLSDTITQFQPTGHRSSYNVTKRDDSSSQETRHQTRRSNLHMLLDSIVICRHMSLEAVISIYIYVWLESGDTGVGWQWIVRNGSR